MVWQKAAADCLRLHTTRIGVVEQAVAVGRKDVISPISDERRDEDAKHEEQPAPPSAYDLERLYKSLL